MKAINASSFCANCLSIIKHKEIIQNKKADDILAHLNILKYNKKIKAINL